MLLTLPDVSQVMGGDLLGTVLLGLSLVTALMLMHLLAAVAMGSTKRFALFGSMATMYLVVVLMSGTLRRTKTEAEQRQASMNEDISWHWNR